MKQFFDKWKKFFVINLVVGGFAFHTLISMGLLNQLDGIWHYGYGGAGNWERATGRWFWPYLDELRFGLFTSPFCDILALSIFTLGNIIVLEILGIGPEVFRAYIVSFMFIVSTSIGVWLSFRFQSPSFATAYLLAVITVYLCKIHVNINLEKQIGSKSSGVLADAILVIFAAISLALSLATYQAFFDATCLVMLAAFMLMLYRNEEKSALVRFFLKSVLSIICGAIIYFIGVNVSLARHGIEHLNSYNEGDSLGIGNTILNVPETIETTIYYFQKYFFGTMFRWNRLQEHLIFRVLLFGVILGAFIVGIVKIARKNIIYSILFTICGLLMPIACNVVLFVATESYLSIQMTNGLVLFLGLVFALIFEILDNNADSTDALLVKNTYIRKAISILAGLVSILVIYGNYISAQIDQEACREGVTGTVTLAGEVLDTLWDMRYVDNGGTVCFVGMPCGNERFMYSEIYPMANELMQFGNWGTTASSHTQTWEGIYREYFGYYVQTCSGEDFERIVERDDVKAMPMFPRTGSITNIDGITVVKISNKY